MSTGSPSSTIISFSLFSMVGKEFLVPWVVLERKVERGEGRGGGLNHSSGQQANKRQNFNKS